MKTITSLYKTIFVSSAILFAGCDGFLEVQPQSSIPDAQPVFDKTSAEQAIRGVYSSLYYGVTFESIGYLSGDNIVWTGSQSQVQEFINHQVNADNSTINGAWTGIYQTINRANNVIASVPQVNDPQLTEALRNSIIGEAHFIRALAYFDLARTWGGVPIILQPTKDASDNSGIPRSSTEQVYAQVLADLETAEPLLSEITDRHRATRKTVWSLKSRYYLYQKDYSKAEEFATKLIADGTNYSLLKPFNTFFQPATARATRESVFEIFYNGTTEINTHRNQWQPQTNGGTRQWAPNDAIVALLNNPQIGGTRSVLVAKDNQNRWYGNLYYRNPGSDPAYVIRIAELYLIRAEARAQQDKLSLALADLNAVRDRAGLAASTAVTKEEILLAIENERRVEFAFEPHRWYDLVRTERADDVLNVTDPRRYVLPIPATQRLIDPALEQNPGY
ncbi:MAG TPA: RagB/SusD family nutrient uptake outer membrane protein [Chryseosolibacter sp.]